LEKLFPTYDFIKYDFIKYLVQLLIVQKQSNCDIFAIIFAISLLFNIKPDRVRYNISL